MLRCDIFSYVEHLSQLHPHYFEHMVNPLCYSECLQYFMSLLKFQPSRALERERGSRPWDRCNRWASHPLAANRVIYNVFESANSHKNTTPERAKKCGVKQQKTLHPHRDVSCRRWEISSPCSERSTKYCLQINREREKKAAFTWPERAPSRFVAICL